MVAPWASASTAFGVPRADTVECVMPTVSTYIRPNGDVYPCCYALPHVMGNVRHHPQAGYCTSCLGLE